MKFGVLYELSIRHLLPKYDILTITNGVDIGYVRVLGKNM